MSDFLVELENSGMIVSSAYFGGRGDFGKEYKLKVSADLIGHSISKKFFDNLLIVIKRKNALEELKNLTKSWSQHGNWSRYSSRLKDL